MTLGIIIAYLIIVLVIGLFPTPFLATFDQLSEKIVERVGAPPAWPEGFGQRRVGAAPTSSRVALGKPPSQAPLPTLAALRPSPTPVMRPRSDADVR